ncbi:uncharacterized protein LOC117782301 [Drosophila innubila]|uniref:uncharacterized protein LOC117782301 n=1 Tax=Drosophila innubila TaxID=198719 RepID=UPI00148BB012|nr:uncharacterized protein LOC117782301 [Drosophila innubila]
MQLTKGSFLLLTVCLSCIGICWTTAISEDLTTNLKNNSTALQTSLKELETLVSNEKNKIRKTALTSGQDSLKVLQSNIDELQTEIDKINKDIGDTNEEQVNTKIEELQTWGEEQLKRVNKSTGGAGVRQANDLIQNVIARYSYSLPKSLEELNILTAQFERDVNAVIKTYAGFAKELIARMKGCKAASANQCRDNIEIWSERVLTSTNQLTRLRRSGKQLVESGLYTSQRVESLLTQLAKDKLRCEKDLDGIIEDNADDSDETTTTESTEADEPTELGD